MLQGFKPPMSATSQDMADELARLSKSALIDVYCQALAAQLGRCDSPVSLEDIREDAMPMLEMRGDRVPSSWNK